MTRIARLRESRTTYSVAFLKFTRIYARNKDCLICVFEGEDSKYYGIRINGTLGNDNWEIIICGGKTQVIRLYTVISQNTLYKSASIAYFVDRDFDPPLPPLLRKNIYETPCYSIENLYTTKACFMRVLKNEFKMDPFDSKDQSYEKCVSHFVKTQQKFHKATTFLNVWIMLQRKKTRNKGIHQINLNNVSLGKLVSINLDRIERKYTITTLNKIFPNAIRLSNKVVNEKVAELGGQNLGEIFRGKYEIEFFRIFLLGLIADRRSMKPKYITCGGKTKLSLSRVNIISELSQYAETPDCLKDYLKKFV